MKTRAAIDAAYGAPIVVEEIQIPDPAVDEVVVKTKNRLYDMRGTLDHLEFNVIKFEPNADGPRESKVYLSKQLGRAVLDGHRSTRAVVQIG